MTYRLALLVPAFVLAACAAVQPLPQPTSPVAIAPPTRIFEAELMPRVDAEDSDAEALLVASAMSYLGKTTARFDGHSMVVVEHDPTELLDEAFADPEFCAMATAADVEPHDGLLTSSEAGTLESSVLAALEG